MFVCHNKKNFLRKIIYVSLLLLFFLSFYEVEAALPPYMELEVLEGQGAGSNEFYQGRCFRINLKINTDGQNSNGADALINYDNTKLKIVNSDCVTDATNIYNDGLYDVYPTDGNSVSATKIKLGAYNNQGSYVNTNNGLFGHFFALVISEFDDYNLSLESAPGVTTDTNIALDGSDIIASVENVTLDLVKDTGIPTIVPISPLADSNNIAVNSGVSFYLRDAQSGINSALTEVSVKSDGGSYFEQLVNHSGQGSTNYNRFYEYIASVVFDGNVKTNDGLYFEYDTKYYVSVTSTDFGDPDIHNKNEEWSFFTETDLDEPYVANQNPSANAENISVDTNIVFRIKDYKNNAGVIPGYGVATTSINIVLDSDTTGINSYSCLSPEITCDDSNINNVLVTIDLDDNFGEYEMVRVTVDAKDLAPLQNIMPTVNYLFTTTDNLRPILSNFLPSKFSSGNASSTDISFSISDVGSGVDLASLQLYVDGDIYTAASPEILVEGDSSNYVITFESASNFVLGRAVIVRIWVSDQSPSSNTNSPYPEEYTFIVGSSSDSCVNCFVDSVYPTEGSTDIALDTNILFHVKEDSGIGIDLNSIVVDINGTLYSNAMDTFTYTDTFGNGSDLDIIINPDTNFEYNVPIYVKIMANDNNGKKMDSKVYALLSYFCSSSSNSCSSEGGTFADLLVYSDDFYQIKTVDDNTVLVTWRTSAPSYGKILYDTSTVLDRGEYPNYNYQKTTSFEKDKKIIHSILIYGLEREQIYYIKPISVKNLGSKDVVFGEERAYSSGCEICEVCETCEVDVCEEKIIFITSTPQVVEEEKDPDKKISDSLQIDEKFYKKIDPDVDEYFINLKERYVDDGGSDSVVDKFLIAVKNISFMNFVSEINGEKINIEENKFVEIENDINSLFIKGTSEKNSVVTIIIE